MAEPYTGVFQELTPIQVALLRAQFIFDISNNEYDQDTAAQLFDMTLLLGYHPDGLTREDLMDELAWMEVNAIEYSVQEESDES